jgi:hypothetical protein
MGPLGGRPQIHRRAGRAARSQPVAEALDPELLLAHRPSDERDVAREDHDVGLGDLAAVLLLDPSEEPARLVEVAVVGPAAFGRSFMYVAPMFNSPMFNLSKADMTSQIAICSKKQALACSLHETFV